MAPLITVSRRSLRAPSLEEVVDAAVWYLKGGGGVRHGAAVYQIHTVARLDGFQRHDQLIRPRIKYTVRAAESDVINPDHRIL